jgi:hypothetical protein
LHVVLVAETDLLAILAHHRVVRPFCSGGLTARKGIDVVDVLSAGVLVLRRADVDPALAQVAVVRAVPDVAAERGAREQRAQQDTAHRGHIQDPHTTKWGGVMSRCPANLHECEIVQD